MRRVAVLELIISLSLIIMVLVACSSASTTSIPQATIPLPTPTVQQVVALPPTTVAPTLVPTSTIQASTPTSLPTSTATVEATSTMQPPTPTLLPTPAVTIETPTVQPITVNTLPSPPPASPQPTFQPIVVNTIPENGNTFEDQLPFQTTANDPAVGPNSGDGITNVTFQFFGPNGKEVFTHVETKTLFCAFGGGDDGQTCNTWYFSEHKNLWPNGRPAQSGPHTLLVTVRTVRDGVVKQQRTMVLELKS